MAPRKKAPKPPIKKTRSDGWSNVLTGIGNATYDKSLATEFVVDELSREDQEALWRGDDMAARIIETIPDEMLREGFDVKIQDDEQASAEGEEPGKYPPGKEPDGDLPTEEDPTAEGEVDPNAKEEPAPDGEQPSDPNAKPGEEKQASPGEGSEENKPQSDPNAPKEDPNAKPLTPEEKAAEELKKKKARGDAFGGPPFGGGGMMPEAPKAPPKPIERKGEDAKKQSEAVMKKLEELFWYDRFREALCYERAYGGAGILLGADDGQDMKLPLNLDAIKTIGWMNVLTPRELYPIAYYSDPRAPKYGEPEIYRIQPETIPTASTSSQKPKAKPDDGKWIEVHESRMVLFKGIKVSRAQQRTLNGWGDSVLVRCHRVLSNFHQSWSSAALLVQDFSQAVYHMEGLADLIATNNDEVVVRRALAVNMTRSVARAVIVDAEEKYERTATPMTGLPEMLEKFSLRLAAAADMPVCLLLGQAPAGLNATGDSDIRFFYDRVSARQNTHLLPALKRLVKIIMLAKDGPTKGKEPENWSIKFNPLWQLTEAEQADVRKTQSDTDVAYITAGVVTPEEIAASRFGGDDYSTETVIDFAGREEAQVTFEEEKAAHDEEKAKMGKEMAKGKVPLPGAPPFGKPGAPPEKASKKTPFGK